MTAKATRTESIRSGECCATVLGIVRLSWIPLETIMDGGCGDGRMAGGNCELMQIANDVPSGVQALYGGLLAGVDVDIADLIAAGLETGSQIGTDLAPERRVQDLGVYAIAADDGHPHAIFKTFNPNRPASTLNARFRESIRHFVTSILLGFEEYDPTGVGP